VIASLHMLVSVSFSKVGVPLYLPLSLTFEQRRMATLLRMFLEVGGVLACLRSILEQFSVLFCFIFTAEKKLSSFHWSELCCYRVLRRMATHSILFCICTTDEEVMKFAFARALLPSCVAPYGYTFDCKEACT